MTVRYLTALACVLSVSLCVTSALAAATTSQDDAKSTVAAKAAKASDAKETAKKGTPGEKPAPFTYAHAQRQTMKTGKPLLVFVGAEWCGACVQMKNRVLPDLKKSRLFKKVSFASVDFDENKLFSRKLTGGGPIPQTILFCKDKDGWHTHKLIGGQTLANVESLIKESLAHAPKAEEETVAGQKTKVR